MSKTLQLLPGETTQEVINQIKTDASRPTPPFGSGVPAPKPNKANSVKPTRRVHHIKQPK